LYRVIIQTIVYVYSTCIVSHTQDESIP